MILKWSQPQSFIRKSLSNKIKLNVIACARIFLLKQYPFPVETLEMDLIAFRRAATCDVEKKWSTCILSVNLFPEHSFVHWYSLIYRVVCVHRVLFGISLLINSYQWYEKNETLYISLSVFLAGPPFSLPFYSPWYLAFLYLYSSVFLSLVYSLISSFPVFICFSVRLILSLRISRSRSPSYFRSLVPPSIFSYP